MTSGIYAICRKDSDECYIGSAVNVGKRRAQHRGDLRNGNHHSRRLQRVHDKFGLDALEFVILEPVDDKENLLAREQVWLDRFNPAYNTAPVAGSCLGVKPSDEHRAKISAANKGRKRPPRSSDTRALMSAAQKGKKRTPEHCAKISAAGKGKKRPTFTADHRAAISAANKGKKRTPETRARMSAAKKGRIFTDEHRAALSAALKGNTRFVGRKHSAETKARMSAAWKLRPPISAETRQKMSASLKARYAAARAKKEAA